PAPTVSAAGVHGALLSISRTNTTDTAAARLTLRYTRFQDAFGGDWAPRLHLVLLPACALTTPSKPQCRTQTPLPSTNNTQTGTVSADIPLADNAAPATVVAATSSGSGS